ncbi:MAG: hypothetical protein M3419_04810 [Actinomycetota bacterium]|nr:hypothetical protein [Actinomycetota bacterium]
MNANHPGGTRPSDSLGSPDHDRSGADIDEAVATAESDSQVEEIHTRSDETASGESRAERIRDVDTVTDGTADSNPDHQATPPDPGPSPADIGSGGAQRIGGARISDRVAAGEAVPDGPPFDTDSEGNPQDSSGAGT